MSLGIAVLGASGRMGRLVLSSVLESSDLRLSAAITDPTCEQRGADAASVGARRRMGAPAADAVLLAAEGGARRRVELR